MTRFPLRHPCVPALGMAVAAALAPATAQAGGAAPVADGSMVLLLTILAAISVAYLLAHFLMERIQRRMLVTSGIEYVVLGVLLGSYSGVLSDEVMLAPVLAFAAGWIGLLDGSSLRISTLGSLPRRALRLAMVDLLVVGGGPGIEPMLKAARVNGVVDHIEVTGPLGQADAIASIRRAWVGLAPYPAEEFFYFSPIKIVEYLAAGIPVVSTRLGDVPDLVAGGGKVVAADDPAAFVGAVDALLRDPMEREVLGSHGRARMAREQTWRAIAHRTIAAVSEFTRAEMT